MNERRKKKVEFYLKNARLPVVNKVLHARVFILGKQKSSKTNSTKNKYMQKTITPKDSMLVIRFCISYKCVIYF